MAEAVSSLGKITADIEPGTLVRKTIDFVEEQLPLWRDYPGRQQVQGEVELTVQLCRFLSIEARKSFFVAEFLHEQPQGGFRRVDLSVSAIEPIVIGAVPYSIFDPYLLIECKRLPTPGNDRQQEYVTGEQRGIKRFKVGNYAVVHNTAVLIAYVQSGDFSEWHASINEWIAALANDPPDDCAWELADQLADIVTNSTSRTCRCESTHDRMPQCPLAIGLTHLWVQMQSS